jgi:hypothetical protein
MEVNHSHYLMKGVCNVLQVLKYSLSKIKQYYEPTILPPLDLKSYSEKQTMLAINQFLLACASYEIDTHPMEGILHFLMKDMMIN